VAYPDTARRHRLAHHHDQRPGRARLGRRRHRGRGRDARPALSTCSPPRWSASLVGKLPEGVTATDLVLTVTQMLRKKGVVDKFVEFFGPGVSRCRSPTAPRSPTWRPSTAPRWASSRSTRRPRLPPLHRPPREHVAKLVEAYCKGAGPLPHRRRARARVHRRARARPRTVEPVARRPQAPAGPRAALGHEEPSARPSLNGPVKGQGFGLRPRPGATPRHLSRARRRSHFELGHGAVVIAAITSCTNTSNPAVMLGRGPRRQEGRRARPHRKPWVKTSLAPGSQVVTEYLKRGGPAAVPRGARLPRRRLRLHHLHRQLRPAPDVDRRAVKRGRPRRRLRALGQPQLRGPRPPRREG
jgi:hypothetical protein